MLGIAVAHLNVSPVDFWQLTLREFWAIFYAKFPPEKEKSILVDSDEPFFDEEEQEEFKKIIERRKEASGISNR